MWVSFQDKWYVLPVVQLAFEEQEPKMEEIKAYAMK